VVGEGQLNRSGRQDPHSVQLSFVQVHLQEAGVVIGGGDQAGSASECGAWTFQIMSLAVEVTSPLIESLYAGVGSSVYHGQAVCFFFRDEEVCVFHSQGCEQVFIQEFVQGLPGRHLYHRSQDILVQAVHVALPGVRIHGERGDCTGDFADSFWLVGQVPVLDVGSFPVFSSESGSHSNACLMCQHIPNPDGAIGRNDLISTLGFDGHGGFHPLRKVLSDGILDTEFSLFLKDENSCTHDGLGHGRDPEHVRELHRVTGFLVPHP